MKKRLSIVTRVRRLFHYIDDFERGIIRVPAFQREFIWKMKDKLALFDSIKNGYPIGSILFWRPDFNGDADFFEFESEKIGSYFIPKKNLDFFYILDGYQRISTLFGCLVNPNETVLKRDNGQWLSQFNIIYNLKEDKFEANKNKGNKELDVFKVPLYKLVDSKEFFGFQKLLLNSSLTQSVIDSYLERYENLSSRLVDYQIPSIDIVGGSAAEAVEIFTRVNSTGVKISDDWKISALSFNPERNFRLGTEIDMLLKDLSVYHFDKIKRNLILQCIVNSFGKVFFDQSNPRVLEELAIRTDFIDTTLKTLENIKKAVRFLYEELWVLSDKLLPYSNQLIFITDFFSKALNPTQFQLGELKRWFWVTSYSSYFTIHNLGKQRLAYKQFQGFIDGQTNNSVFSDKPNQRFSVPKFPVKINMGSVRAKCLALFLLKRLKESGQVLGRETTYKMLPLFKFPESREDANVSQNFVFVVDDNFMTPIQKKNKDLSTLLESNEDLFDYFISEEQKDIYRTTSDKYSVLNYRRTEIMLAERQFVESMGLLYEE